jgi:hypothetical protein
MNILNKYSPKMKDISDSINLFLCEYLIIMRFIFMLNIISLNLFHFLETKYFNIKLLIN